MSNQILDIAQDTQPLANLRDNVDQLINQLRTTHRPITLTVDGRPQAILQDPADYQRLLDLAAEASAEEGIRQGLADLAAGRCRPAKEVLDELRAKYRISR